MKTKTLSKIIKYFIFFISIIWLVFGIYHLIKFSTFIIPFLIFVNAVIFLLIGIYFQKLRWVFNFSIMYVLLNIILTFTDEFGFFDIVYLVIGIFLLILLIIWGKKK